jgi:hypothetical protein
MSSNQVAFSTVSRYSTFFLNLDNSPYLGNDNNPTTYKMGTTASAIGANSVLPPVPTSTTNSTEADSKTAQATTTKMPAPKSESSNGFLPRFFNDPLGATIVALGSLGIGALFGLFRGKAAHA